MATMVEYAPVVAANMNATISNGTLFIQIETGPRITPVPAHTLCDYLICLFKSCIFCLENLVTHPQAANCIIETLYHGPKVRV